MSYDFEALKNRVIEFLEAQPGYSQKPIEKLEVIQEDESISIIYGENLWGKL